MISRKEFDQLKQRVFELELRNHFYLRDVCENAYLDDIVEAIINYLELKIEYQPKEFILTTKEKESK